MGFKETAEEFAFAKILYNEPMKKHTSLGVGGNAKYFAKIDSLYSLNSLIQIAKECGVKYKVIGNGTNVLVSDLGFDGLIITTKGLADIMMKRDKVRAMAGAPLDKLIKFNLDHGFTGLESLSGIPATVGGAVVMNAGAFGHNISEHVYEIETIADGKIKRYFKDECKFCYRGSRFLKSKETVVSATFEFDENAKEIILAGMKTYLELRKHMHPTGRSCGSVFKNPKPDSAGALIDRAGLKGVAIGGAKISAKHGNFITTSPSATALDVRKLILHIKEKIKDVFGVELKEEVEYVGEF
ncbi:MAG: UDP-N-acetylmuramate dehydrogenase [Clostridia bacterium]|nr:UDP-N-acetylmuramate dehydrogenase [Clostridia bacterium]